MINLAQSFVSGFNPQTEITFETINVEDGINAFFKSNSVEEARLVLYNIQIDPRQKIDAFYSSIITSNLDASTLANQLDIISQADILYGKIMKTQNWRLLRYLNDILIKLYHNDDRIRYTQYNISWPLSKSYSLGWSKNKIIFFNHGKKITYVFKQLCYNLSSLHFVLYAQKKSQLCSFRKLF